MCGTWFFNFFHLLTAVLLPVVKSNLLCVCVDINVQYLSYVPMAMPTQFTFWNSATTKIKISTKKTNKTFVPFFNIFMQWILTLIKIYLRVFFLRISMPCNRVFVIFYLNLTYMMLFSPCDRLGILLRFFFGQNINSIFISLYQSSTGAWRYLFCVLHILQLCWCSFINLLLSCDTVQALQTELTIPFLGNRIRAFIPFHYSFRILKANCREI